mgnify:CR=1 FL=1
MWTDPVVEEIQKIQEKMFAEVGGDTAKLMAEIRENQATGGCVIVGEVRRCVAVPTATEPTSQAKAI